MVCFLQKMVYLFEIAEKNTKFVGWKQKLTDEKREKTKFSIH